MSDAIIKILPDSVSNQIAAGEVVQRPASVVKELMENAVDAGATSITLNVREGGKELIHIIDNGKGMNERDAVIAFQRHATSKISEARDLFALKTFGFRGEALAAISSVSELELKTKTADSGTGTRVVIHGGDLVEQGEVVCPNGTQFAVKSLFYNVPGRRKFLSKESSELKHILSEFQRVVLCNPNINFTFYNNGSLVHDLRVSSLRQRIVNLKGKAINANLLEINVDTSIVKIHGFIGNPQGAKKTPGEQFMFVNNRFFKHPYFHKAVMAAYEKLIPAAYTPSYFLYFTIDPADIDINVHPAKTEVKFEQEQAVWQILNAAVKETLGKFGAVPMMDFELDREIEIPAFNARASFNTPSEFLNPCYNPFDDEPAAGNPAGEVSHRNWERLYDKFEEYDTPVKSNERELHIKEPVASYSAGRPTVREIESDWSADGEDQPLFNDELLPQAQFMVAGRYIAATRGAEMVLVDLFGAHQRVLYEDFLAKLSDGSTVKQQELFPVRVELAAQEYDRLREWAGELADAGFDLGFSDGGVVEVKGIPAEAIAANPEELIHSLLHDMDTAEGVKHNNRQSVAAAMARSCAICRATNLSPEQMDDLLRRLFACSHPGYTPSGKRIIVTLAARDIARLFA